LEEQVYTLKKFARFGAAASAKSNTAGVEMQFRELKGGDVIAKDLAISVGTAFLQN
jgi:hypothetical protein